MLLPMQGFPTEQEGRTGTVMIVIGIHPHFTGMRDEHLRDRKGQSRSPGKPQSRLSCNHCRPYRLSCVG